MAYSRPTIIAGITRATKAFFENIFDGIDEMHSEVGGRLSDATLDTTYAPASLAGDVAAKYTKPAPGIPSTDLDDAVQQSLGDADTALQSVGVDDLTATGTKDSTTFLRGDNTFAVVPSASADIPSWGISTRSFDQALGVFNLRPDNMSKWRAARAKAAGGLGQAHVACHGDSITYGAAAFGASIPKPTNSWPGRLRRQFDALYGPGGSGVIPMRATMTTSPGDDPRIVFTGTIEDRLAGMFGLSSKRWLDASGANYVTFTETCEEFWIYAIGASSRPQVQIDGGTIMLIAGNTNTDPALTDPDQESGYWKKSPDDGFGQVVTKIPAGALGSHALKVRAPSNGTSYAQVHALEARIPDQGVRVSNLGYNGISTAEMILDETTYGVTGMAQSFDMVQADCAVLLLSMNDFQVHRSKAAFKANVTTLVQRQKASGGFNANGDVLLVSCAQPDYVNIPADHVLTPAMSEYYTALYEVADEQDVPLLDLADRWQDFGTSNALGYFADSLHPGDLGLEDIAQAVFNVLQAV